MNRTIFLIAVILLVGLMPLLASEPELRTAIVEIDDAHIRISSRGLAEYLTAEEQPFVDLSDLFLRGETPDLSPYDLLLVGSFITDDPTMLATYQSAETGAELRRFVADGGVVVVFTQIQNRLKTESWMEPPRTITRTAEDFDRAWVVRDDHPLLTGPEAIDPNRLRGWRIPETQSARRTLWDAFEDWEEGGVILGSAGIANPPEAGMIEMGWGKGRAIFIAMAPDKAFVAGNEVAIESGSRLLRNLLHYADTVRRGDAPPVIPTLTPGYKHPVRGQVFLDHNASGTFDDGDEPLAGVAVSDMEDFALTDESGFYELPNARGRALFVYVHQSDRFEYSGRDFFHRLPTGGEGAERYDFALRSALSDRDPVGGARFAQITDLHIRNADDGEQMAKALSEIHRMSPPPDFIAATGDLVEWGIDDHFSNYMAVVENVSLPYFSIFGNHELTFSPGIHLHHDYVGPDYFSFERGGIIFLSLNPVTPSERQEAWMARAVELLRLDRPIAVLQHYPPNRASLERFAAMGVTSVISGHWHSEKEFEHAGVRSINSPPFFMGGIDASPAGFKMVEIRPDGTVKTEWRYAYQEERLTVVSPPPGAPVGNRFCLLVNAYDTGRNVASVRWAIQKAGEPVASGVLLQDSAMGWRSAELVELDKGEYVLRVVAVDQAGESWAREQAVDVSLDTAPSVPDPVSERPMFMGNASHTGQSADTIRTLPLRLAWAVDTGGDPDFSSPILADGRIHLALKKRTANRVHGVAAFDPANGERLWLRETAMAVNHTPAYADGVLCVAEMGGRIHGIDAASGDLLWHYDQIDPLERYSYCAPAVYEGAFYAGVFRELIRFNPADGESDWRHPFGPNRDWISSYGSPALHDGVVVMSGMFGDYGALARSLETGEELWKHRAQGGMLGSPTIAGDRVLLAGKHSTLYCVGLKDGEEIWRRGLGAVEEEPSYYAIPMWPATTPAVAMATDGEGIVVAGSGDGHMRGLNLADGEILWTHVAGDSIFRISPYRRDDRPLFSSPTISGGKVFFGSSDGWLYCLDLKTGSVLWSHEIGTPVMSTPLVSGNALYVAAYDGRLYAFTR